MQNNGTNGLNCEQFTISLIWELAHGAEKGSYAHERKIGSVTRRNPLGSPRAPEDIELTMNMVLALSTWFFAQAIAQPLSVARTRMNLVGAEAFMSPHIPGLNASYNTEGLIILENTERHWVTHLVFASKLYRIFKEPMEHPERGHSYVLPFINTLVADKRQAAGLTDAHDGGGLLAYPSLIQQEGGQYCGFITFLNGLSYALLCEKARRAREDEGVEPDKAFYEEQRYKYDIAPYMILDETHARYKDRMRTFIHACMEPLQGIVQDRANHNHVPELFTFCGGYKDNIPRGYKSYISGLLTDLSTIGIIIEPRYNVRVNRVAPPKKGTADGSESDMPLTDIDRAYSELFTPLWAEIQDNPNGDRFETVRAGIGRLLALDPKAVKLGLHENDDFIIKLTTRILDTMSSLTALPPTEISEDSINQMWDMPEYDFWTKKPEQNNDVHYVATKKAEFMERLEALYWQLDELKQLSPDQVQLRKEVVRLHRAVEYTTRAGSSFAQQARDLGGAEALVAQYEQQVNAPNIGQLNTLTSTFYPNIWDGKYRTFNADTTRLFDDDTYLEWVASCSPKSAAHTAPASSSSATTAVPQVNKPFNPFDRARRLEAFRRNAPNNPIVRERPQTADDEEVARMLDNQLNPPRKPQSYPHTSSTISGAESDDEFAKTMQFAEYNNFPPPSPKRTTTPASSPATRTTTTTASPPPGTSNTTTTANTASASPQPSGVTAGRPRLDGDAPVAVLPTDEEIPALAKAGALIREGKPADQLSVDRLAALLANMPPLPPPPGAPVAPSNPATSTTTTTAVSHPLSGAPTPGAIPPANPADGTGLRRRPAAAQSATPNAGAPTPQPAAAPLPASTPMYIPKNTTPAQTQRGALSVPKTLVCVSTTALVSFFLDTSIIMPFMSAMDRMEFKDIMKIFDLSWQRTFNPLAPGPELIGAPAVGAFLPILLLIGTTIGITYLAYTKGWLDLKVNPDVVTSVNSAMSSIHLKTI